MATNLKVAEFQDCPRAFFSSGWGQKFHFLRNRSKEGVFQSLAMIGLQPKDVALLGEASILSVVSSGMNWRGRLLLGSHLTVVFEV